MPIELNLRDSARIALAISAAFPIGAAAATAGRLDFAIGAVSALSRDGQSRSLTKGSDVNPGETITTGDGRAQLRYTDGSQVSLQPGTQYRIDDYRFNGKNDGEETAIFSLIKGSFRTITGLIGKGNREAYKVNTATATIGIRGTEFVVLSDENGVTVSTGEGAVQVCTAGGCIILASGESAVVTNKEGKPVRVTNTGSNTTNSKPETPSVKIDKPKDEGLTQTQTASLPSGSGYAMAIAGQRSYDGGEVVVGERFANSHTPGTATFSGTSELTKFVVDGGEGAAPSYVAASVATGLTDGTIGWGRWTSGSDTNNAAGSTYSGNNVLGNTHYIVGQPTSSAQIESLALGNMKGTYALSGFTFATSYNATTQVTTTGSGSISGNLTVFFNTGVLSYNLSNITVDGSTYGITNGTAAFGSQAGFSGGGGSVTGGSCTAYLTTNGFFVGANAARAGLVYQFNDFGPAIKTISGAAVFKQTTLGYAPPG